MLSYEEAKAIMRVGLGRAELEFVTSIAAPLYWVIPSGKGRLQARNGSAFFLDAGAGLFGVTAAHVVRGLQKARTTGGPISCQLGRDLVFDLDGKHTLIAIDDAIDIATFRITLEEVKAIGKTVLTGFQKSWPPSPPQVDRGIYHVGFPGVSTLWLSPRAVSFGAAPGSGVASSVNETDVCTLIEREHLMDMMGTGLPPENFDFGGISGGPMLTVIEYKGLRSWQLAGVIYEGPNPSDDPREAIAGLEIFRARRTHFLLPDGTLDQARWAAQRLLRGQ